MIVVRLAIAAAYNIVLRLAIETTKDGLNRSPLDIVKASD